MLPIYTNSLPPLKKPEEGIYNYAKELFKDYDIRAEIAYKNPNILSEDVLKIPKEEIESNRKVGSILKYKGNLRISWAFDMNYSKNIDLIFFPEENPYINYVCLYAKDFPKTIKKEEDRYLSLEDRELEEIYPPYNINYDFVKEILAKSDLSVAQQERFFQVRFGSVFIPMEIEFEWYAYPSSFSGYDIGLSPITFPFYDRYLRYEDKSGDEDPLIMFIGIIKYYSVLPINTQLNCDYEKNLGYNHETKRVITYKEIFTPLPISALANTQTNINDFIVNLRDKPDTKEGKIVAQLLGQKLKWNQELLDEESKFQILISSKGFNLFRQYEKNSNADILDIIGYISYYQYFLSKQYYNSHKQKLINPLWRDEYLILVWNIESNNWAKVWVLRTPNDNTQSRLNNEKILKDVKDDLFGWKSDRLLRYIEEFISHSYIDTFNNSPSKLKLYEGYIHCSGLTYLMPFSENYIKR